jgi:hypothetical protein
LIDGCATCVQGGTITGLRLTHFEERGGFFSGCSDEPEYNAYKADNLKIKIPPGSKVESNSASFSVPVILMHRSCNNIFYTPKTSNKFNDIRLHIDYMLVFL